MPDEPSLSAPPLPEPLLSQPSAATDATALLIADLTRLHLTLAVAESLTGGALAAELIRIPGASVVVNGAVVAYQTELKHSLLGVDRALLAEHGPVHPDVARQMAAGARTRLAVGGRDADIGVATTGVASPDAQSGHAPGTVFLGLSRGSESWAVELRLDGDRAGIRAGTVARAVEAVRQLLARETVE
ncbi:CinA family protein [Cryobacterium sp. TMT1-21]|uniref:CinA family protein n=1 Tax=Cryobacterium shii TaxID=1259235 RepID=A0AAQ2HF90_9MICO|nr:MULTISPECIES: CinA family protein [Cryobacterium]TFC43838.1 CinA family protein [Cryobacterium shii]TFC80647.1 CinA family protein [Cryobacterium sp. TmT2-59]TFD14031.1 CinA family protein [Cryobacterium sp. TMT1-21]TFD20296.1 CinA family protein [Cryobacterium sp. TMT4-10]TFD23214.1 CinA family protein [Cryobacterium sp. TMT2-23]